MLGILSTLFWFGNSKRVKLQRFCSVLPRGASLQAWFALAAQME